MKKSELISWLRSEQPNIEKIILNAANDFVSKNSHHSNFGYDLACSQEEGYNLMNGEDLCYDRYTTALSYSLWYQARRINVFLSHFLEKIIDACTSNQPVNIFDLGAGTGCVQLCFGLVNSCFQRKGLQMPLLRIINVDSSPFMLSYLKEYIWPHALIIYPECKAMGIEYHTCSWSNSSDIEITNPWICASYLFDSSDNEDYLSQHFKQLIIDFDPEKILLLTSNQTTKKKMINELAKKMQENDYVVSTSSNSSIFSGNLNTITDLRKALVAKYQLKASARPVSWEDGSFAGLGLAKRQTGLSFVLKSVPQEYDLFNSPLKIRRDVKLNELQLKAAEYETRPSIITGPAGCGKSVVMTEKNINVIENFKWAVPLQILVTTFNKSLLKQLRSWLTDLLNAKSKSIKQIYFLGNTDKNDGAGEIVISDVAEIRIKFVHFEMLGKYLAGIPNKAFEESEHKSRIIDLIKEVQSDFKLGVDEYKDVMNADFILEEYHRVIYGLNCKISDGIDKYYAISRTGRGNKIQLNQKKREVVWHVIKKYALWMHSDKKAGHSFVARRQILLNELSKPENTIPKFDYVFVDEFQDCTPADFKIMTSLLKDVNNLVISGDLAQAVHIGQSGIIPRDELMSKRIYHRLEGSYRLPYRVSEAIQPLSREISGNSGDKEVTLEMTPSKGAPPGSRPIIVYAENNASLVTQLISIKECYSVYDLKTVTILEYDGELCRELRRPGITVETSTVLKLKGLEKEMIVWSLQAPIEFENEVMEFAYTIMTRTNCLLVIAITTDYKPYNLQVLSYLRKDRLIYWNEDAKKYCG